MGIYYYTPFKFTDDNERVTWNMFREWGVKFADCAQDAWHKPPIDVGSSEKRRCMKANELAQKLVDDGLENRALNIVLICCFSAGPQPHEEAEFQKKKANPWLGAPTAEQTYGGYCLAQSLAKALGLAMTAQPAHAGREPVPLKVCGFLGPTFTKDGRIEVTLDDKNKVRASAWDYERWFDWKGVSSSPNPNVGGPERGSQADLSGLADGDELVIMGHGSWMMGGLILPFPGRFQEENFREEVNRTERMNGQPAKLGAKKKVNLEKVYRI